MKAFFRKEVFSTPYYLPGGKIAPFIEVGDDEGVLATESDWLAGELRRAAHRHVGGVIEISEAEYEELKKKPVKPLPKPQQIQMYAGELLQEAQKQKAAQAVQPTAQSEKVPAVVDLAEKKQRVTDIAASRPKAARVKRAT